MKLNEPNAEHTWEDTWPVFLELYPDQAGNLENFSEVQIIIHCLLEPTFFGFKLQQIETVKKYLEGSAGVARDNRG